MINIPELYNVFLSWYKKNGNTSTNIDFAWSSFLAGSEAQNSDNYNTRIEHLETVAQLAQESRINELEMWRGNRPGG
jgi:hypothetical protein